MATPILPTVQFDDRYNTRPVQAVDVATGLVNVADAVITADSIYSKRALSEDLAAVTEAFTAENSAISEVGDNTGVLSATVNPEKLSSDAARRELKNLQGMIDRNKSAAEQGVISNKAFYTRTDQLVKEAIARRPSLRNDLIALAAKEVGFDPRQGLEVIMSENKARLDEARRQVAESPQAKYQAKLEETALTLSPRFTNPTTGEVDMAGARREAALMLQQKTLADSAKAVYETVDFEGKSTGLTSSKFVTAFDANATAQINIALLAIPQNKDQMIGMINSGEFNKGIGVMRTKLYTEAAALRDRMLAEAKGDPDLVTAANKVFTESTAKADAQIKRISDVLESDMSVEEKSLRLGQLRNEVAGESQLRGMGITNPVALSAVKTLVNQALTLNTTLTATGQQQATALGGQIMKGIKGAALQNATDFSVPAAGSAPAPAKWNVDGVPKNTNLVPRSATPQQAAVMQAEVVDGFERKTPVSLETLKNFGGVFAETTLSTVFADTLPSSKKAEVIKANVGAAYNFLNSPQAAGTFSVPDPSTGNYNRGKSGYQQSLHAAAAWLADPANHRVFAEETRADAAYGAQLGAVAGLAKKAAVTEARTTLISIPELKDRVQLVRTDAGDGRTVYMRAVLDEAGLSGQQLNKLRNATTYLNESLSTMHNSWVGAFAATNRPVSYDTSGMVAKEMQGLGYRIYGG